MKKTKAVLLGVILWSLLLVSGCNFIRIEEEPRKPLEYSIVKNEDLPAELAALIQEKKANEFQLTYQSEKELFLIKGYGQQMSGGYSISVEESCDWDIPDEFDVPDMDLSVLPPS